MDMGAYLAEIAHAVDALIAVIWEDRRRLDELCARATKLEKVVADGYRRAAAIAVDAEDPDDVMLATGIQWETYFGADKEHHAARREIGELRALMAAHEFSVSALCGALLHYGKQGISMVHGKPGACPPGRPVGSQPLKDVVWSGRNQAAHWEEGKPYKEVQACFEKLEREIDPKFSQYTTRNMAFDVGHLLCWIDRAAFEKDMTSLA